MTPKAAQQKLVQADKKLKSSTGWFSSTRTKHEEAGDLYQEAANLFKIEKMFKEAGDTFAKEAECRDDANEAATAWWNSAKAYKLGYPDLAVEALGQTITFLTKTGRFRQAADREKEIGDIYNNELNGRSKAAESYVRAAEWYQQEGSSATGASCMKDAADILAELERYPEAMELYDNVAREYMKSPLTKYNVKDPLLRSLLCALAMKDAVIAKRNLMRYETEDLAFHESRECKLARALSDAVESGDVEEFTRKVIEYDQVSKLNSWQTTILLRIKESIKNQEIDIL